MLISSSPDWDSRNDEDCMDTVYLNIPFKYWFPDDFTSNKV